MSKSIENPVVFDHFYIYFWYKVDLQIWTFRLIFEPLESISSGQFRLGRRKSWFDHDIKQNLALDRLHCRSLVNGPALGFFSGFGIISQLVGSNFLGGFRLISSKVSNV